MTGAGRGQRRRGQRERPDGEGYLAHEETVEKLAAHIGSNFRKFQIAEVKSITSKNEVGQLQKGLGQVLHNRFKAERHGLAELRAYLIAEREPANRRLWSDLCAEVGVIFTWPERFELDVPSPAAE